MFTVGALLLALGTAVFKPGLQGIIATQIKKENSSLAWALFYQLVNLGAFLGPPLAGVMRLMDWKYVFLSCAGIVALNYLLFFTFAEPDKPEGARTGREPFLTTLIQSAEGILEPRLMAFLAIFSGFWAMFYQLFDLLPNFITDWVDSSDLYAAVAAPVMGLFGSTPPEDWAGMVPQEHMINLNAGMIMVMAFAVGFATGKLRSMQAMIVGILVSAIGIYSLGLSTTGFWILGSIVLFSLGEMMASPTKMRYFSSIAPPGKQALYLGYVNATTGIGWSLGSLIAGSMYEEGGDKVVLARRYLVEEQGMDASAVEALAKTDVLPTLADRLGQSTEAVRELLYTTYEPQHIWTWFTVIGVVSMVGLLAFDIITRRNAKWEEDALIVVTGVVTGICYGWMVGLWFFAHMGLRRFVGSRPVALLVMVEIAGYVAWSVGSSLLG
jgi:dipeptide/tripeptide permease